MVLTGSSVNDRPVHNFVNPTLAKHYYEQIPLSPQCGLASTLKKVCTGIMNAVHQLVVLVVL